MLIVAETIKAQIGHKALCMIGAKDLVGSADTLRFRIGRGAKNGITHLSVKLNADDLYEITAIKYLPRKLETKVVDTYSNVYANSLNYVIKCTTGFETSL